MNNLKDLMIGISEFKKRLNEIVSNKLTKIIVKNNTPISVILPYEEYNALKEKAEYSKNELNRLGQDITMTNGVPLMVLAEKEDNGICIKTYVKMKTTGDYSLNFTQHISSPPQDSVYTSKELVEQMMQKTDTL